MRPEIINQPLLIATIGQPGTGKTFFASQFANTFNAPFISANSIRSLVYKKPTYDQKEEDVITTLVYLQLAETFKTKKAIVLDTPLQTKKERDDLSRIAKKAGYRLTLILMQSNDIVAQNRATDPVKPDSMTDQQYKMVLKAFEQPDIKENVIVLSGQHTFKSQLRLVINRLSSSLKPDNIQNIIDRQTRILKNK
mgnify:FL=1